MEQRWQPVQLKRVVISKSSSQHSCQLTEEENIHPHTEEIAQGESGKDLQAVGKGGKRKGMLSAAGNIRGCAESTGGCFPIAGSDVFPTITLWEVFPTLFVADYLSSDQWGE